MDDLILLDLQERLHADRDGTERDRAVAVLEAVRQDSRGRAKAGAPPAEFATLSAIGDAADTAIQVLQAAWQRSHGSRA